MDDQETVPALSSEDEDGWEEVEDQVTMETKTQCLFCDEMQPGTAQTISHCAKVHNFHLRKAHDLDCISYIKMINYIRRHKPSVATLTQLLVGPVPWYSDDYMQPEIQDDAMLQFDIEDFCLNPLEEKQSPVNGSCFLDETGDPTQDTIIIQSSKYSRLLQKLQVAEQRVSKTEQELQETMAAMNKMRGVAKEFLGAGSVLSVPSSEAVSNLKVDEDESYFGGYGHFSIHQTMLQDTVRTESYRDAILKNKEMFKDKVVLDIGCGTGILSMFAASAGAKLVIGVDMSDVIYQAIDIVKENKLDGCIKLIRGKMEDVDLPVDKVDIIISEWMGYFLLYESMLDTVIWAREHYLADSGVVLPNVCTISIVGLSDSDMYNKNYMYWNEVYGYKMTCMKQAVAREGLVCIVKPESVITEPGIIKELDCQSCSTKDLEFSSEFSLKVLKCGDITAVVGYFDINFSNVTNKVTFSTGPCEKLTHWKQTAFLLEKPITVKQGDELNGKMIVSKNRKDPRALKITLSLKEWTQTFVMD